MVLSGAPVQCTSATHQVIGPEYNDFVYFMPRREECDALMALSDNVGWDGYSRCACAGAVLSVEGGAVRDGQMTLPQGLLSPGEHVVCQAYYVEDTYAKPEYFDADFTPVRAFRFDGVVRASVVPPLEPSESLVHMLFTLRVRLAHPGYVRFVLADGGDGAASCSFEARQGAPGGELSAIDCDGYRSLTLTVAEPGVYRVCHAFFNELAAAPLEEQATFTLQELPRQLRVSFAVASVTPRLVRPPAPPR